MKNSEPSLRIAVITVSDTRTEANDSSGAALVEFVNRAGHTLVGKVILKDDLHDLRSQVVNYCDQDGVDVVLLTGGTGITARDVTPEAVEVIFEKAIPGFGELFRMLSFDEIGASTIQSRALAGVRKKTLIFALPGSTGAVRLAVEQILRPQLDSRTKPCNFVQLISRL